MKFTYLHKTCLMLALLTATSFNLSAQNGVKVSAKLYLKGALTGSGLMRDDLRSKGFLPTTEPYSNLANFQHYGDGGGEVVSSPAVFQVTGPDAIVDWVVVELRSPNAIATPVATQAALLQRDGDVVGVDGVSPVQFLTVAPGQYHVSVRHRNHLGVMTVEALALSNLPLFVDFSNPLLPLYGTNPCAVNGSTRSLWQGDTNRDKRVNGQGPGNDFQLMFTHVLYAPDNTNHLLNYIVHGYLQADTNMDGDVIYLGPNNDRSHMVYSVILVNCAYMNCTVVEQIP